MNPHSRISLSVVATFLFLVPSSTSAQTIQLERVATGLSRPLYATSAPGVPDRLFIAEQGGAIKVLDLPTRTIQSAPVMSIGNLATGNEQGLLGLVFDPDYASNGRFYTNAVETGGAFNNGRTVVNRYQMTGNPLTSTTASTASVLPIMSFDQPFANHNGGWMGFSPRDGNLYIASGDGGAANDPQNNGQRLDTFLGKMLRIDPRVDGFVNDPNRNYSIPTSNPFANTAGAQAEIWAYGLRNPFRSSFDRVTGDLWIGDVGQNVREEINFQAASSNGGENYGWRLREGTIATPTVGGPLPPGAIDPVYDYLHGAGALQGNSVTGGYVYRGPDPTLQGKYIFGDFVTANVWAFNYDGQNLTNFERLNGRFAVDAGAINSISSFAEDGSGNLYLIDLDGDIFRFTAVPEPGSMALCSMVGLSAWLIARRRRKGFSTRPKATITS